ncbi:hypothetical protein LWI29_029105 [Acer saccharum]|uniref:ATP-dependent DNA helicase n=1 Tax=Acer saccharum TaxID=4024 RepID=A0AA39VP37_ACESA|nr:hypothetical protein LWI29_029105 [Acer saccharum]KAK1551049.1 hypothetical protein Q3G72_029287 [Acer saccharum]
MEHKELYSGLNVQQMNVHDIVVQSVIEKKGGLYFVYGAGGTGKTYLYKTILSRLKSEGKICLAVASSRIASLLLLGGRTAHSRFSIPIDLNDQSTCNIHQGTHMTELIKKTSLIIWNEAPMDHRNTFEAVNRSLKDIMRFNDVHSHEKPFGGITVLLSGDFRQTLYVVLKGRREDVVQASINKSPIWKSCQVLVLTENMRIKDSTSFTEWVLALGDGKLPTISLEGEEDSCWIVIPDDLLIPISADPISSIVSSIYPDLINKYKDLEYLRNRGILTPTNQTVDEINSYVLNVIPGEITTYLSYNSICKASRKVFDQDMMFHVEFLNSLKFPGLPNHELHLKIGIPIILLRNINPSAGLCNGTQLIVTQLAPLVIEGKIITVSNIGTKVFIPRIIMTSSDPKWPFA